MELLARGCLSRRGNPNAEAFGRRACLSPSWRESADGRVAQEPRLRKNSGGPKGKSDLSEQLGGGIK